MGVWYFVFGVWCLGVGVGGWLLLRQLNGGKHPTDWGSPAGVAGMGGLPVSMFFSGLILMAQFLAEHKTLNTKN
jgi:hypothetical protein